MTVTVYLVRHGETDLNAANRCQGSLDVPMNAAGEAQVVELRARLADIRFDAAYTSPLGRASNSARILLNDSEVPLTNVAALTELSYGKWQGTSHAEWPGNAAAQWRDNPWATTFPDGESLADVQRRVVPALHEIVRAHSAESHQKILVTAHGHVNRVLLLELMKRNADEFWSVKQVNCETWKLCFHVTSGGEVELVSASLVGERVTRAVAQHTIDMKTKPLGALGHLETCAVQLAVLQQSLTPDVSAMRVCVFGADHGISDEGVSAYPRAVTAEMMKNFSAGGAAINVLGRVNDVQVEVIDVGVDADLSALANVRREKVRNGSRNFAVEAAMSNEELNDALLVGAAAVRRAVSSGVQAIGLGEMGIGNTTSAAALLSALTGQSAETTVGVGTGVNSATLTLKRDVVSRAIALHGTRSATVSARECLRRVGGFELAAIAGAALEALHHPIAIVADGFISTVSVLAAAYIVQEERAERVHAFADRVFLAHQSSERGHSLAVQSLGLVLEVPLRPLLDMEMRLGEGSGAALAMPLLRAAAAIMRDMATFESAGVSAGDKIEQHS